MQGKRKIKKKLRAVSDNISSASISQTGITVNIMISSYTALHQKKITEKHNRVIHSKYKN